MADTDTVIADRAETVEPVETSMLEQNSYPHVDVRL